MATTTASALIAGAMPKAADEEKYKQSLSNIKTLSWALMSAPDEGCLGAEEVEFFSQLSHFFPRNPRKVGAYLRNQCTDEPASLRCYSTNSTAYWPSDKK